MPTIRKRRTKAGIRWQAMVRLAGMPPSSSVHKGRKEAAAWARDEESRLQRERRLQASSTGHTVEDAIFRYLETVMGRKAAGTQRNDRRHLKWWHQRIGYIRLHDLTRALLVQCRDELAAPYGKKKRRRSGPTINRYMVSLSAVLTRAESEWEWLPRNPLRRAGWKFQEPPGRVRYFTAEESERILAACTKRSHELRVLFLLALATGMRQGELMALTWDRVDLTRRVIVLYETKNRTPRGVPIPEPVVPELRSLTRRLDSPLLFRFRTKLPWNTFRKDWEAAMKEAGVKGAVFHSVRHSTASHATMSGASTREVMDLLGHKSEAMAKRYAHMHPEHLRGVSERAATQALPPSMLHRSPAAVAAGDESAAPPSPDPPPAPPSRPAGPRARRPGRRGRS